MLRDLSFTAAPGQTVAIVGETGSGKSTLTKLVNRIYDVDEGRDPGRRRRRARLEPRLAALADLDHRAGHRALLALDRREHRLRPRPAGRPGGDRAGRRATPRRDDFIARASDGYDTVIGERGVTLSGGQRQRLAIARALLTDPRILILDDSTSAIDSATEDEIQQAIAPLLEGRTTLLITHRLSQIRWADKILVLQRGELVDQGTHDELLGRCALYRRIFAHYDEVDAPDESPTVPIVPHHDRADRWSPRDTERRADMGFVMDGLDAEDVRPHLRRPRAAAPDPAATSGPSSRR